MHVCVMCICHSLCFSLIFLLKSDSKANVYSLFGYTVYSTVYLLLGYYVFVVRLLCICC